MGMRDRIRSAWAAWKGYSPVSMLAGGTMRYTTGLGHNASPEKMVEEFRSWVYKCVNRRGQDMGRIVRRVSRELGEEEYEDLQRAHPLMNLLRQPNPFMSGFYFVWYSQMWLDLTGNVYLLRFRNKLGKTAELWPLDTRRMRIVPDPVAYIRAYEYNVGTHTYTLDPGDVIHIKYPNPADPFYGASPLMAAAYSVDIDIAAKVHQNEFLRYNPAPRLAFESEGYLTQDTVNQLRNQIRETMTSTDRGLPLISHQGAKAKVLSLTPQEIDYLKSVENARDEIITTYGVPSSVLGISKDVNRANEEAKLVTYGRFTLDPLAQLWDEALQVLAAEWEPRLVVRHDSPIPGDREQDRNDMKTRLETGVTSINEERRGLGWDPVEGGDEPLVRVGYVRLSQVGEDALDEPAAPTAPAPEDDDDQQTDDESTDNQSNEDAERSMRAQTRGKAERAAYWDTAHAMTEPHVRSMTSAMRRYFLRQAEDVLGRMKKNAGAHSVRTAGDPLVVDAVVFDVEDWNAVLEQLGLAAMYAGFEDAWKFAMAQIDGDLAMDLTPESVRQMMRQALDKLKGVNSETAQQITETLTEGIGNQETLEELTERVLNVYRDATRYRAQRIARTTQTQAINRGMLDAWQRGKVGKKMWISARLDNTRDAHLAADGQTVAIGDAFVVGGEQLQYPGDPAGSAGNIIHCQCFISPVVEK